MPCASLGGGPAESVSPGTLSLAPSELMQYGPDGLLSSEVVNQGSVTQRFGYDLAGGAPRKVADYSGTALGTSYFFGARSGAPMDMIVGGVSYYHRDGVGSITSLTDPSGGVQASYHYDAYRNPLPGSGDNVGNPYRREALPWDTATGLIHDGARFIDPTATCGRRLQSRDPAEGG